MTISFTLKEDDVLVCRVDDNGIGREAAGRARKSIKVRESMGIRMTSDRIKLMKEQDNTADLLIIDKMDEAGRGTGTAVVITLPVNAR